MILVFILAFIILVNVVFILSSIKLNINKLVIDNEKTEESQTDFIKELHIYFQIYFLNKIKIAQIEINKEKIKKIPIGKIKEKLKKINIEELKNSELEKKEIKKAFEALKIDLEKLKFQIDVGTESVLLTSAIVTIISSLTGIIISKIIKEYNKDKYYYKIMPIYNNENKIKLNFKCIICIKLVHIIYVIYILIKMRRVKKNERASNRRAYDYSYE